LYNVNVFDDTFGGNGNLIRYTRCQDIRAKTKPFTTFVQANLNRFLDWNVNRFGQMEYGL